MVTSHERDYLPDYYGNLFRDWSENTTMSRLQRIVATARRKKRIRDGLVLCENCDTPASKSLSLSVGWTACAPCVWGEADSFDATDLIHDAIDELLTEGLR
jgi:hypothetical protein